MLWVYYDVELFVVVEMIYRFCDLIAIWFDALVIWWFVFCCCLVKGMVLCYFSVVSLLIGWVDCCLLLMLVDLLLCRHNGVVGFLYFLV